RAVGLDGDELAVVGADIDRSIRPDDRAACPRIAQKAIFPSQGIGEHAVDEPAAAPRRIAPKLVPDVGSNAHDRRSPLADHLCATRLGASIEKATPAAAGDRSFNAIARASGEREATALVRRPLMVASLQERTLSSPCWA